MLFISCCDYLEIDFKKLFNQLYKRENRMLENFRRGGFKSIKHSVLDYIHYDLSRRGESINTDEYNFINNCYMQSSFGNPIVDLPGYSLEVHSDDPGISRDLLLKGIREPFSYWKYRNLLQNLDDSPIILEVGANIGYYAIASAIERPDSKILCSELIQKNVDLLKRNVERNNVEDNFDIQCTALSDKNEEVSVVMADESNLNSISSRATGERGPKISTVAAVDFVKNLGYDLCDIDCLRMDVQGLESKIIKSLKLAELQLAHIEIHPRLMSSCDWKDMMQNLDSLNLEPVKIIQQEREFSITDMKDLPSNRTSEVIFIQKN